MLRANADLLGTANLTLRLRRHVQGIGAHHLIFTQLVDGKPIHRAYVTVHMDRQGRVYLIKNRAVPTGFLPRVTHAFVLGHAKARARALSSVRGRNARVRALELRPCWFPRGKHLLPAYRVRIHRTTRTTRSEWIVFIHAETGTVISKYDNLAAATARARLFDPNPLARVADWETLAGPAARGTDNVRRARHPPDAAYRMVMLRGLPASGLLDGPRVSTSLTRPRVRIRGTFMTPNSGLHFEEVMVYYHVDAAVRYLESLGFRQARRIFAEPIRVNARGTRDDNSWYSPGLRTLTFGTGGIDDAEDGETIVHELGHAVQDAICPDFGQSQEAAAMGEGFGDYLAASVFAGKKPESLRTLVMSWDAFEASQSVPPRLRTVDSPLTFESFDHRPAADEHENGRIWSATLWDVRRCFRHPADADRVVVESHFQLDGFTTMARGARALLDADRNLHAGAHVAGLRQVFRERGVGPVE